jgi:Transposase DDE domain
MRMPNKGWDYCGNAQASVDGACQIVLACDVADATNDKQQAEPLAQATLATLAQAGIEPPKDESGDVQSIPATVDKGYYRERAVQALEDWGFDPSRAPGRQKHHEPEVEASAAPTAAKERMAAKVRTPAGKAVYARRKAIVEPVFGPIKAARGVRRFLLRGVQNIRGAWRLVCLTHNLLKIWRYGRVLNAVSAV